MAYFGAGSITESVVRNSTIYDAQDQYEVDGTWIHDNTTGALTMQPIQASFQTGMTVGQSCLYETGVFREVTI